MCPRQCWCCKNHHVPNVTDAFCSKGNHYITNWISQECKRVPPCRKFKCIKSCKQCIMDILLDQLSIMFRGVQQKTLKLHNTICPVADQLEVVRNGNLQWWGWVYIYHSKIYSYHDRMHLINMPGWPFPMFATLDQDKSHLRKHISYPQR